MDGERRMNKSFFGRAMSRRQRNNHIAILQEKKQDENLTAINAMNKTTTRSSYRLEEDTTTTTAAAFLKGESKAYCGSHLFHDFQPETTAITERKKTAVVITGISVHNNDVEEEEKAQISDDDDSLEEFHFCLNLLESADLEDNRLGMEKLIHITNSELVNMAVGHSGSIARMLSCTSTEQDHAATQSKDAKRLQAALLAFLCDSDSMLKPLVNQVGFDDDASLSSIESGFEGEEEDTKTGKHGGIHKLPLLRVLASSLELLYCSKGRNDDKHNNILDLTTTFWSNVLQFMSKMLEDVEMRKMEAAFSVKCLHLLYKMDPRRIGGLVQHSLLPHLLHAKEFGSQNRCRMLVKETEALLSKAEAASISSFN